MHILSNTCRTSFIAGLFCGAAAQQENPNLKQLSRASSLPSAAPRIAGFTILIALLFSACGAANPDSHWHTSTSESTLPAISSNRTTPYEYTSDFALSFRFCVISGEWYGVADEEELPPHGLDRSGRSAVDHLLPNIRADMLRLELLLLLLLTENRRSKPKSLISGSMSASSKMLLGFM